MKAFWYTKAIVKSLKGQIDLSQYSVKVLLTSSDYIPDQAGHEYRSDTWGELSSPGYAPGGEVIEDITLTQSQKVVRVLGSDLEWSDASILARYAILYLDTPGEKPLLGYIDFEYNVSSFEGIFKINWDTKGIFELTVG